MIFLYFYAGTLQVELYFVLASLKFVQPCSRMSSRILSTIRCLGLAHIIFVTIICIRLMFCLIGFIKILFYHFCFRLFILFFFKSHLLKLKLVKIRVFMEKVFYNFYLILEHHLYNILFDVFWMILTYVENRFNFNKQSQFLHFEDMIEITFAQVELTILRFFFT